MNRAGVSYAAVVMATAQDLLDRARSPAHLEALEADPGRYAAQLATELPTAGTIPELEERDAALANALGQVEAMSARAMKLRLEHALAGDTSIGEPTRRVFAQTVTSYAGRLPLLAQRARDVAASGRAPDPDRVAELVEGAARSVLELRAALRTGVFSLIRERALAAAVEADHQARDRRLDEPVRRRWSAARRELEATAADPARVVTAPLTARLAAQPEQLDEPDPAAEPTFADLIELD